MKLSKGVFLPAAIAAALAGGTLANAGTFATGTANFSIQYAAREAALSATSTQVLPSAAYTPSVAGVNGDLITITLEGTAGAQFSTNTTTSGSFGRLRCQAAGGAANSLTATNVSGTATTRVFSLGGATDAAVCNFDNAALKNTNLQTAGTVRLSLSHTRAGAVIESANAATQANVANQFAASVLRPGFPLATSTTENRFSGTIDNAANSTAFVAGTIDAGTTDDVLLIDLDNVSSVNDATLDTTVAGVLTLNGDFSFLVNTGITTPDTCATPTAANDNRLVVTDATAAAAVGTVTSATCSQIVIAFSKAQIDAMTNAADDLKVVLSNAATGNYLSPQDFSATFEWKYSTASSTVTQTKSDTLNIGSWDASGVTVFVPYMPTGAGISQTLYVTNNTAGSGVVTMTSRNTTGAACTAYPSVTVGARRVVDLGAALAAGLAACGGAGVTDKHAITITAELPDGGLEVYSAYNVSGNRVTVINSSNGRSTAGGVGADNSTQ